MVADRLRSAPRRTAVQEDEVQTVARIGQWIQPTEACSNAGERDAAPTDPSIETPGNARPVHVLCLRTLIRRCCVAECCQNSSAVCLNCHEFDLSNLRARQRFALDFPKLVNVAPCQTPSSCLAHVTLLAVSVVSSRDVTAANRTCIVRSQRAGAAHLSARLRQLTHASSALTSIAGN